MSTIITSRDDLPKDILELLIEAKKVSVNAYNRYSNFFVGAAVKTTSGKIYTGTNLENASYGLSICAEPAAIMNANSNGDNNIEIIAIVGGFNEDPKQEPVTPCGRCRQVIYEASQIVGKDIKVYCSNLNLSKIRVTTIEELLPFAFHLKEV
ncbi:MAG: cytidine deaminase [Bacteroidetes bacterium]|nr:cytidine deaminase [Bacteroidota bacterium]